MPNTRPAPPPVENFPFAAFSSFVSSHHNIKPQDIIKPSPSRLYLSFIMPSSDVVYSPSKPRTTLVLATNFDDDRKSHLTLPLHVISPSESSNSSDEASFSSHHVSLEEDIIQISKTDHKRAEENGDHVEEPLLKENPHRFVLFPIQDNEVRQFQRLIFCIMTEDNRDEVFL
jgi:hypothetical protein